MSFIFYPERERDKFAVSPKEGRTDFKKESAEGVSK